MRVSRSLWDGVICGLPTNTKRTNTDTDFSLANYREVDTRLAEYQRIGNMVEKILKALPEDKKACYYQSLYYPVKGCELLNRMILNGQRNRWYSIQQGNCTAELEKMTKGFVMIVWK